MCLRHDSIQCRTRLPAVPLPNVCATAAVPCLSQTCGPVHSCVDSVTVQPLCSADRPTRVFSRWLHETHWLSKQPSFTVRIRPSASARIRPSMLCWAVLGCALRIVRPRVICHCAGALDAPTAVQRYSFTLPTVCSSTVQLVRSIRSHESSPHRRLAAPIE